MISLSLFQREHPFNKLHHTIMVSLISRIGHFYCPSTNLLRNTVAHLDPMGDSLVIDDFEDVAQCERAIPVIKYISRAMLQNELQSNPNLELVQTS